MFCFRGSMKGTFKAVLLGVILLVPVLIYIFLQAFGENRYALPVYGAEGTKITGCEGISFPHTVEALACATTDSLFSASLVGRIDRLYHFPDGNDSVRNLEANEIRRFLQKTSSHSYRLITFAQPEKGESYWQNLSERADPAKKRWVAGSCSNDLATIKNCTLLLPLAEAKRPHSASRMILVDSRGLIRGFYVGSDKEEIDRLIIEMDILNQEK